MMNGMCRHCNVRMSVQRRIYTDENGDEYDDSYYVCDQCGADYG